MNFNWESTAIAIVAFLLLYWLLNKYAFGPLFSVMEKRRELLKEQLETSEKNRLESENLVKEQKESLQQTRKEAYDIIEQAKKAGNKQAEDIVALAKEEANRLKDGAIKDIEVEKNKAVAELRGQVSNLSVMIASKIIEKQIDDAAQDELVNQYLKEVGDKP